MRIGLPTLEVGHRCTTISGLSIEIGITGAGTHAARATSVEQALAGKPLDAATLDAACATAADGLELMSDSYASGDYRAHLTRVLTKRAVQQAAEAAKGR